MHTASEFYGAEVAARDPRIKKLSKTIRKDGARSDALIPVLHEIQNAFGYLPKEVLAWVAREMKLPPSRVYGVVTFYHFFSLKPRGEHNCLVCTGTACFVKGAMKILDRIREEFGISPGEITPDNRLGVQTARCIGACGLAPAVVMDDEIVARVRPEQLRELVEAHMAEAAETAATAEAR